MTSAWAPAAVFDGVTSNAVTSNAACCRPGAEQQRRGGERACDPCPHVRYLLVASRQPQRRNGARLAGISARTGGDAPCPARRARGRARPRRWRRRSPAAGWGRGRAPAAGRAIGSAAGRRNSRDQNPRGGGSSTDEGLGLRLGWRGIHHRRQRGERDLRPPAGRLEVHGAGGQVALPFDDRLRLRARDADLAELAQVAGERGHVRQLRPQLGRALDERALGFHGTGLRPPGADPFRT